VSLQVIRVQVKCITWISICIGISCTSTLSGGQGAGEREREGEMEGGRGREGGMEREGKRERVGGRDRER